MPIASVELPELTPEEQAQGMHWQPTKRAGLFVVHDGKRIVHTFLDPQTASELGKGRLGGEDQELADTLAREAGYVDLDASPGWYQVLCRLALKSDASAISAVRELRASATVQEAPRRDFQADKTAKYLAGEGTCPTCGNWPDLRVPIKASLWAHMHMDDADGKEAVDKLAAIARRLQELQPDFWALDGMDPDVLLMATRSA